MKAMVLEHELMTPVEVAHYVRLKNPEESGKGTVMRWVRHGRLKAARVGDLYRFRRRDVDDFIFSKR